MRLLVILPFLLNVGCVPAKPADTFTYLTRDEAKHVGAEFVARHVVSQFRRSKAGKSAGLQDNDFLQHHNIVESFCLQRYGRTQRKCSWSDYYAVLDDVRQPFDGYFDPGASEQIPIHSIYRGSLPKKLKRTSGAEECDEIESPSAKDFLKLLEASHPVIIKNAAKSWPALSKWSLKNLRQEWHDRNVVVSVSPSGDFDGPENASLWGLDTNESIIIARPAHLQMKFHEFITTAELARNDNATFYLEYFPLKTMQKEGSEDVPPIPWANFLSPRFTLIWFGMSGVKKPVGRLHYDRFENLMAMVSGSKQFVLYGPDQGKELYAATPARSGSLAYTRFNNKSDYVINAIGDHEESRGTFIRDKSRVDEEFNNYHTYSPVDITNPNFEQFPKFRDAKRLICDVSKGDILFVPADWWHQVTSTMDDEGKSIGVNIFFEPFYKKPGYLTLLNSFIKNRYYSHIYRTNGAILNRKGNKIRFQYAGRKGRVQGAD